jgi:hypothetical protein
VDFRGLSLIETPRLPILSKTPHSPYKKEKLSRSCSIKKKKTYHTQEHILLFIWSKTSIVNEQVNYPD